MNVERNGEGGDDECEKKDDRRWHVDRSDDRLCHGRTEYTPLAARRQVHKTERGKQENEHTAELNGPETSFKGPKDRDREEYERKGKEHVSHTEEP